MPRVNRATIAYIDKIEPEHSRNSCGELNDSNNYAFVIDGRVDETCRRCTLLHVAKLAAGEINYDPSAN